MTESLLQQAINCLYETPLHSDAWPQFFDCTSHLLQTLGGQYLVLDRDTADIHFSFTSEPYDNCIRKVVPGAQYALMALSQSGREDQALFQADCAGHCDLGNFHRHTGIRYISFWRSYSLHSSASFLVWFRNQDQGVMGEQEIRWIDRLRPHFERVNSLQAEVLYRRRTSSLAARILDHLDLPIFALRDKGAIAFVNQAAEAWISSNPYFRMRSACLAGVTADCQVLLDELLESALDQGKWGIRALPHAGRMIPYHLLGLPLRLQGQFQAGLAASRSLALLMITDPLADTHLTTENMKDLFGLTSAESRIALELAAGKSLDEMTDRGVSINTIRTQLGFIRKKTGLRRQAALVKTINSLPRLRRQIDPA